MSQEQFTERDLDYVADTRELIKDVLTSNNIPPEICLAALTSTILNMLIDGSKGPGEFSRKVLQLIDSMQKTSIVMILQRMEDK